MIIDSSYSYFNSTGIEDDGYTYIDPATYNAFKMAMLAGLAMYRSYENTDPTFNCSNVKQFAGHVRCPEIDEAMLHTYIRFGESDRWGKRNAEMYPAWASLGRKDRARKPGRAYEAMTETAKP